MFGQKNSGELVRTYPLNKVVSIGRESYVDIFTDNMLVSGYHGAIYCIKDILYYEDVSSNGSIWRRGTISKKIYKARVPLMVGDLIAILNEEEGLKIVVQGIGKEVIRLLITGVSFDERKILDGNLNLMSSSKKGGMLYTLIRESLGGNAGYYEERGETYPCAGANFFYDGSTGEIVYFGNFQDVPKNIVEAYNEGTFRIAIDFKRKVNNFFKILEFLPRVEVSKRANQVILNSIALYNKKMKD